ncbi:hypothetical protein QBC39DRAFT_374317 [Podospora conica]|nr:hypothetical protein QBC39DRAFT_374317 [Schizothecium conicum]
MRPSSGEPAAARKVIHAVSDVGRPKVKSARESVLGVNPHIDVRPPPMRLTAPSREPLTTLLDYNMLRSLPAASPAPERACFGIDAEVDVQGH